MGGQENLELQGRARLMVAALLTSPHTFESSVSQSMHGSWHCDGSLPDDLCLLSFSQQFDWFLASL